MSTSPTLFTVWHRVRPGPWMPAHVCDAARIEGEAQRLREYGRTSGIEDYDVKVLPAAEVPEGYRHQGRIR